MLLWFHWEAMLVSYLSVRKTYLPFESVEELVNNEKDFKIVASPGSSLMDTFKFSKNDIWQKGWTNQMQPYLEDYKKDWKNSGVNYLMDNSNVALYSHFQIIITFSEYEKCEIIAIPKKYNFQPIAFGFQKDSPYLDIFNYYLREMIEKGVMKQISERYKVSQQVCPDFNGSPLGFESCFAPYLILIIGTIMGFLFMIFEIITEKMRVVKDIFCRKI